jgi:hypothetical protein
MSKLRELITGNPNADTNLYGIALLVVISSITQILVSVIALALGKIGLGITDLCLVCLWIVVLLRVRANERAFLQRERFSNK